MTATFVSPRIPVATADGGEWRRRAPHRRLPAGVYRRRRIVALALVAVLAWAAPAAAGRVASVLGGVPASTPAHRATVTYVVRPGDTLWGVARRLQPEGDVRPLVSALERANGGVDLRVGQVLVLP